MKKNILIFIVMSINYTFAQNSTHLCDRLMTDGKSKFNEKKYAEAVEYFKSAATLDCTTANMWLKKSKDEIQKEKQTTKFVPITLSVSEKIFCVSSQNNERSVSISVSPKVNWEILNDPQEGFNVEKDEENRNTVLITIDANPNSEDRPFYFRIIAGYAYETIKIIQQGSEPYLNISPSFINFPARGGEKRYIKVRSNVNWTWKEQKPVGWNYSRWTIKKDSTAKQLVITCPENPKGTTRSFEVVIKSNNNEDIQKTITDNACRFVRVGSENNEDIQKTIPVNQEEAKLSVSSDSIVFPSYGGKRTIKISTNLGWKIITEDLSQGFVKESQTDDSITISCGKLPTHIKDRYGKIIIKTGELDQTIIDLEQLEQQ